MCFFCDTNANNNEDATNKAEEEPRFNFTDLFNTAPGTSNDRPNIPKTEVKPSIDDILFNDELLRQFLDEQHSDPVSVASAIIDEQFESPLDAPDINNLIQYIDGGSDRIQLLTSVPLPQGQGVQMMSPQGQATPIFKPSTFNPVVGEKRSMSALDLDKKESKKQKREDEDDEEKRKRKADKKKRLVWTTELHNLFVQAVTQLGLNNAAPKTILQIMNVKGLTTEHIKSHLQKYRLSLKKTTDDEHVPMLTPAATNTPQCTSVPLDFLATNNKQQDNPLSSLLLANMLKTQFGPDVSFTPEQYNFLMMGATLGYKLGLKEGIQLSMPSSNAAVASYPSMPTMPATPISNMNVTFPSFNVQNAMFPSQQQQQQQHGFFAAH